MNTKQELEQKIINITSTIRDKYPELSSFISEMPQNNSEDEKVNLKNLEDYYHSLEEIIRQYSKTHNVSVAANNLQSSHYSDRQLYPPSEDIYVQNKEESDINPEDISEKKSKNKKNGLFNEKDFNDDMSGSDLDVPGSELDDQQESVGSEDEENNYYSLGGDNHNDLEEDRA